jgi:hypothetical protein
MNRADKLTTEARQLLERARGADEPTPADIEQVLRAFRAGRGRSRRTRLARATNRRGWLTAALVLSLSCAALAYWRQLRHEATDSPANPALNSTAPNGVTRVESTPRAVERPPPSLGIPAGGASTLADGGLPSDATTSTAATRAKAAHTPAPARRGPGPRSAVVGHRDSTARGRDDLALEVALIARARDALSRQDYPRALELTGEHARSFPTGVMLEERSAIATLAQCRTTPDLAPAKGFVDRWPNSVFASQVSRACRVNAPQSRPSPIDARHDGEQQ